MEDEDVLQWSQLNWNKGKKKKENKKLGTYKF